MKQLIKKYIEKLTINDLEKFATNNNIILNNQELETIYSFIKENWETIITDYKAINYLKNKINNDAYSKLKELLLKYKNKYQSFL